MLGQNWSNLYWAAQNIQNLKESIVSLAKRDELLKIRNVNQKIAEVIRSEINQI
jgi:DNA polymerase/3'-5' exonuclease PolX